MPVFVRMSVQVMCICNEDAMFMADLFMLAWRGRWSLFSAYSSCHSEINWTNEKNCWPVIFWHIYGHFICIIISPYITLMWNKYSEILQFIHLASCFLSHILITNQHSLKLFLSFYVQTVSYKWVLFMHTSTCVFIYL